MPHAGGVRQAPYAGVMALGGYAVAACLPCRISISRNVCCSAVGCQATRVATPYARRGSFTLVRTMRKTPSLSSNSASCRVKSVSRSLVASSERARPRDVVDTLAVGFFFADANSRSNARKRGVVGPERSSRARDDRHRAIGKRSRQMQARARRKSAVIALNCSRARCGNARDGKRAPNPDRRKQQAGHQGDSTDADVRNRPAVRNGRAECCGNPGS